MNIALWVIQGLLAVVYLAAGGLKSLQPVRAQEQMPWAKRHTTDYLRRVGVVEVLGALGLILPAATGILPWLTPLAALGLAIVQLLAIFMEHLPSKETKALPMNVVLLVLALCVVVGRLLVPA